MSDRTAATNTAPARFQTTPVSPPPPGGSGSGQVGEWRGEAVKLEAPGSLSLLDKAKEELTFAHSEDVETKDIKEREISRPEHARIVEVHATDEFFERLPHFNRAELQAFLRLLRGSSPDTDTILRMVGERFQDPSEAYAALELSARTLREEGRSELADRVSAAATRLMAEKGPAIRAGLNVSVTANAVASGDRQEASTLRNFYRDTVAAAPGPAALYGDILDKFGVQGFAARVSFLSRALGDDLRSAGPSIDPKQLNELLNGLSSLRVLDTVHERCNDLVAHLWRQNKVSVTSTDVMKELLPLTEAAVVGSSRAAVIPSKLGLPAKNFAAQIALLRGSRELLGRMPVSVFRSLDARSAALQAVQEAMDAVIEQEESA